MGNDPYSELVGTILTTHPGPTLATADRLREMVRRIGPDWDVLGLLNAILHDWEPRLAALVPPIPAVGSQNGLAGVQTPSRPVLSHKLVFGEEPYEIRFKAGKSRGRR